MGDLVAQGKTIQFLVPMEGRMAISVRCVLSCCEYQGPQAGRAGGPDEEALGCHPKNHSTERESALHEACNPLSS